MCTLVAPSGLVRRLCQTVNVLANRTFLVAIAIALVACSSRAHSHAAIVVAYALCVSHAAVLVLALVALGVCPGRWSLFVALGMASGFFYALRYDAWESIYILASMAPFGFFTMLRFPLIWNAQRASCVAARGQFTLRACLGATLAVACAFAVLHSERELALFGASLWAPLCLLCAAFWGRMSLARRSLAAIAALLIAPWTGSAVGVYIHIDDGGHVQDAIAETYAVHGLFPYEAIANRWLFGVDATYDAATAVAPWSPCGTLAYSAAVSTSFAALGFAILRWNGLVRLERGSVPPERLEKAPIEHAIRALTN